MPRCAVFVLSALAALAAGCDVASTRDLDAPAYTPGVALRATFAAGQVPVVRLGLSRDPYGASTDDRLASPTPAGAVVTLWRDGVRVETLAAQPQTCYTRRETVCDPVTGRTEVAVEEGAYECGAFGGTQAVEAGATYTVRTEVPGYPAAEATVTVPPPATVAAMEIGSPGDETRRLSVRVDDVPGASSRFGLVVFRDYDRVTRSVCAVGGPRDTTVTLGYTARYATHFGSTDAVLTDDAVAPPAGYRLATFTDAAFAGGAATVTVDVPREGTVTSVGTTGGLTVQVAVLSETLYEAYRAVAGQPEGDNPFLEPANVPTNVEGGYGRVGAVALTDAAVP